MVFNNMFKYINKHSFFVLILVAKSQIRMPTHVIKTLQFTNRLELANSDNL